MGKYLASWLILGAVVCAGAASLAAAADDANPDAKNQVPKSFAMPFKATTRAAAVAWQQEARRRLMDLVAAQTPRRSVAELLLDFKVESQEDRGDYILHHASFRCNDGQRRTCLWTTPKGPGPFPAMLCLHGHGGSAQQVFDAKSIYRGFGERFARGGYCVLAPSFPHRKYAASTLWDLIRCVDILAAQKQVDPQRIGVMGLSMGGEWTMWVAACDQRLKVAVVSGWMCTTEGVFSVPNCECWELPGLVELMDICEAELLIAPRPVLFESAEADECFPIRYTREGFNRIRAGYKILGAEENCRQDTFPGGHAVHGDLAYAWVDKVLDGSAAVRRRVELKNHESKGQLQILLDGKEALVYQYGKDVDLPHYYPLRSPSDQSLTIEHPNPYPHHRSVWVADTVQLAGHPSTSFFMSWNSKDKKNPQAGFRDRIRHVRFLNQQVGVARARIDAQLLWEADYGKVPVLDERRELDIRPLRNGEYVLSLDFKLTASYGDVKFLSDRTHYAWPYVRMAPAFSMDHGGTITSSVGVVRREDIDAKGMYARRAKWVDYSNTVGGVTEGVAIFATDKQPPRWFTRSYGTFGPRRPDAQSGVPFILKKGDSLKQCVGILVHSGDVKSGRVAERYQQFLDDTIDRAEQ